MNKVSEFETDNYKEYKVKAIQDSVVYTKEADGYLQGLHYLIAKKSYPEEENTWEPSLTVMHLQKMVSTFHKDHMEKLIANKISNFWLCFTNCKANFKLPTNRK